jgi:hypothetical protein
VAGVTVKAVTLTQPWASLVAFGEKRLETRTWSTPYRGPVAIHAARGFPGWAQYLCVDEPSFKRALARHGVGGPAELPIGQVVALARLADVVRTDAPALADLMTDQERAFGDFGIGRYAWVLQDVRPVTPFACRGQLGLWELELPDGLAA